MSGVTPASGWSLVHQLWVASNEWLNNLPAQCGANYKAPAHEMSYFHKNSKERGQAPLPLLPFLRGTQFFIVWTRLQHPLSWSACPALPGRVRYGFPKLPLTPGHITSPGTYRIEL